MSFRQNAFIAILLVALTEIIGDWSSLPAGGRLWCLPAALLLLGLAYERLAVQRCGLELKVVPPPRWRLAQPQHVSIELWHAMGRPLLVELAPDAPVALEMSRAILTINVPAAVREQVGLRAVPRRLGRHVWPRMRARVAGPLGLAWWSMRFSDPVAVAVQPDLLGGGRDIRGAERAGERAGARIGAGGEILQLRDFRPGDPLRAIDWKATARRRSLVARDFAEDQRLEVIVGIDAGRGSSIWCGELDRLGHYVNLAARFAERVVAQDDSIGLVVFGDQPLASLPPARGTAALIRLRALLAALEPQRTDSNPIHAAARIRSMVRRRCLVILLTDIDDAAGSGQLAAAVRLLRPQHLPIVASVRGYEAGRPLRAVGDDWMAPYRALAQMEQQQRLERAVGALHALGVTAVLARPERLESAVVEAYARFRRQRRV